MKNGKGIIKEYFSDGALKFEGEYFNGKGKSYNSFGNLIYEGENLNEEKHAKGNNLIKMVS